MSGFDPFDATLIQLQDAMAQGQTSARALVAYYFERIRRFDQTGVTLNAIRAVNPQAIRAAQELDEERRAGQVRGPLHGIPIVVKDNYETRDMATTAGSRLLAQFETGQDAVLVQRLREAGAVVLAKSNMHEFAFGITTFGSLFGQTKNPYAPTRNAGGSSGGTAAAVAANFAAIGMGSDTCGSIRIPAGHNNLVGLRGTQGLASRTGIIPLSHTQDIGGPIGRCIADVALVLDATVGFDASDPQTAAALAQIPDSYFAGLANTGIGGKRVGLLLPAMQSHETEREVAAVIGNAVRELRDSLTILEVDMPDLESLLDDPQGGHLVLMQDFKWDIGDYFSSRPQAGVTSLQEIIASDQCHPAVMGRLHAAEATAEREGADYLRELARRSDLRQALLALLADQQLDALMYPSIRNLPVALGDYEQPGSNCRISAKSGLPALSLPAGFSSGGIPVGMELLGPAFSEMSLLQLGAGIERQLNCRKAPDL